jgi:hypothetical protein
MRRAVLLVLAACGVNQTPQPSPVPTLPECVPNRDGQITADELPIALGATLPYYAATNTQVALVPNASGVYDLSQEPANKTIVAVGPVALGTQWYAAAFPVGQFVVDAGGGLDGIYHQDTTALWLDGTASQQQGASKTLIVYPTPLPVLRFPLVDAEAWTATAPLPAGTELSGLPFLGTDTLAADVTLGARLDVPYVQFSPILRVRTLVTRAPSTGTPVVTKRTTIFLFECFGEVTRAESNVDEPNADFTTAALLRRYALGETP